MTIEDMDRKMAERVFTVRNEKIKAQIRALPLAEKLRLAADFLDSGAADRALAVARLAVKELEQGGTPCAPTPAKTDDAGNRGGAEPETGQEPQTP